MDHEGIRGQQIRIAKPCGAITIQPIEQGTQFWLDVTFNLDSDLVGHDVAMVVIHPKDCGCDLPPEEKQ